MGVRKMRHQMFPPNHVDNSFEWFRNQHQLNDHYFHNGAFNPYDLNQQQNEMIQRYYGNMIQPYSQNQIQATEIPQTMQMMETAPTSEPQTFQDMDPMEDIQQHAYPEQGTMFASPPEYTQVQPHMMQNPAGQYPSQSYSPAIESGFPGYGQQPQATNYANFQLYSNPYGVQNFHSEFPNFTQQQPQHQQPQHQQFGQMMQGGPFSTPSMFAPSTPYPTQPKQLNQQSNNGQSFQFSSILNQFKNSSGSYDVPKMMSTAGQMMNTVNQVGGLFKQIGFFFK